MPALYGFSVVSNETKDHGAKEGGRVTTCAVTAGTTALSRQRCAQCNDGIERFLPDHYALYPVSKVFEAIRATCREARTETACRLHLADIDSILDNNRRHLPTLFLTLKQIPYRDPAPLHALLQLGESGWRAEVNQTQLDDLLNRYIARSVAIVGDLDFARARLDCQVVMPGDYVRCRDYLGRLARLMRNR
jgi:hypothetical protein